MPFVKGTDGSNMIWTSKKNTLENIRPDEKYYLNVVQIIMDFEASILGGKKDLILLKMPNVLMKLIK